VAGAVGFTIDPVEKVVRVFELISLHDHVVRFLLSELERLCRAEWGVRYIEVDVSAYAPRMQRTLLELHFMPVAYVPALVFHEVERLDVVKMARLLVPLDLGNVTLSPKAKSVADIVLRGLASRSVLPRIAHAVQRVALFEGLNEEQVNRVAGMCTLKVFEPGQVIFSEGSAENELYLLLAGEVLIHVGGNPVPVDTVSESECLGEMALLTTAPHSATALARSPVEAAVLGRAELAELVRRRPDIGLFVYRNLALGLGKKLRRSGRAGAALEEAS
jgi:hypothetical protein